MVEFIIVFVDRKTGGEYSVNIGDSMEIGIYCSSKNTGHQKTAAIIRKAVRNLGIMARITEHDAKNGFPKIIVDGFDLTLQLRQPGNAAGGPINYDSVLKALERTAW